MATLNLSPHYEPTLSNDGHGLSKALGNRPSKKGMTCGHPPSVDGPGLHLELVSVGFIANNLVDVGLPIWSV